MKRRDFGCLEVWHRDCLLEELRELPFNLKFVSGSHVFGLLDRRSPEIKKSYETAESPKL